MMAAIRQRFRPKAVKTGEELINEWGEWMRANDTAGYKPKQENATGQATGFKLMELESHCSDLQKNDRNWPEAKRVNEVLRELPLDEYDACYHCRYRGISQDEYAELKGSSRLKVRRLMTLAEGAVQYAVNSRN